MIISCYNIILAVLGVMFSSENPRKLKNACDSCGRNGGVGGLSGGCGETRSRAGAGANLGAGRRRSERVLRMYTNCGDSGGGGVGLSDGGVRAHCGATCANSYRRSSTSAVAAAAARAFTFMVLYIFYICTYIFVTYILKLVYYV